MSGSRLVPVTLGLCVILGANFFAFRAWYSQPLAEKQVEVEGISDRIESTRRRTAELLDTRGDLASAASMTLGRTVQTAEERLRSTLNELVRSTGITEVRVDTRVDRNPTVNPASDARLDAFRRRDERGRLRSTPEAAFTRMIATLTGSGETSAVLRTVAMIESQQWMNRVVRFKFDPRQEGSRADFIIEVETFFMPDRSPETGPGLSPASPDREALAMSLLSRTPLSAPEPPKPDPTPPPRPVVEKPEPPKPTPPPPYDAWRVAFLRDGSSGPELTIRRGNSSDSRVLKPGDRFHEMEFRGFEGIYAIFELDGKAYRIGVGQNLANRDNPEAVQ